MAGYMQICIYNETELVKFTRNVLDFVTFLYILGKIAEYWAVK